MWRLRADELGALAEGAALLGSGGGGDPYWFRALAEHTLAGRDGIEILDTDDVGEDTLIVAAGLVGSLLAFHERPPQGSEFGRAVRRVGDEFPSRHLVVCNYESAGANVFAAIVVAAGSGIPLVDCDGMGRALSWLDQTTFDAAGVPIAPFVLTDSAGQSVLYERVGGRSAERFIRAAAVQMGGWCAFAGYPMSVADMGDAGIAGTIARALSLGNTVRAAQGRDVVSALIAEQGARRIGGGRVVEAQWRRIADGGIGSVVIRSTDTGEVIRVEARNEFLLVLVDGEIAGCTPDILCVMRTRDGHPLQAESMVTGTEVEVVVLPAPQRWCVPGFREKVAPAEFGLTGV
ncbi:MAG: DUF917 domain-containing protein [Gordonia sp. (in: high G+C Gram-positive bacteria)]